MNLLEYKKNVFSQNGEDGIIEKIFQLINVTTGVCCEFGAWDGIHLCNVRNLVLNGWKCVFIEGDSERYQDLLKNYQSNPNVTCVNAFVDFEENNLDKILKDAGHSELDFLSIDIDGLDFEIFENLKISPKVICIEVNAGHDPESTKRIDQKVSKNNVGQPLGLFIKIAQQKNYDLVCYTGNAFFVRRDLLQASPLQPISALQAYQDFLNNLSLEEKKYLYRLNFEQEPPYYSFCNPQLTPKNLHLDFTTALKTRVQPYLNQVKKRIKEVIYGDQT